MNRCVELHDSNLIEFVDAGEHVVLILEPGYVHASPGEPGRASGTVWTQTVVFRFADAVPEEAVPALPERIAEGWLESGGERLSNVIPLPFNSQERVRLELTLCSGESLRVSGRSVSVTSTGRAKYLEDFAAQQ